MPALETKFLALTAAFRFIVFGLMVTGLIVRLSAHHRSTDEIVRPVARAITVTALLASQAWWFPLLENTFRLSADYIQPAYNDNPTRIADEIREAAAPNPDNSEFSWTNMVDSIYHKITDGISYLFIKIATLLVAPFTYLQYILKWVLYFLTPFALGCLMIPTLVPMSVRFFQQLLAILAWPVGFALTNVVTQGIWQDYRSYFGSNVVAKAVTSYHPYINQPGLLLAAIALIIGIISTPIVCNMLFSSGAALTGASSTPAAIMRGATNTLGQLAGAVTSLKTLGALAAVKTAASAASPKDGGGKSENSAAKPPPLPPYSNPFVHPPGL